MDSCWPAPADHERSQLERPKASLIRQENENGPGNSQVDQGIASSSRIRMNHAQPSQVDYDTASYAENHIAPIIAEISAHQAMQKSILGRTMRLGCIENSLLSKEELATEIIAYHDTPDTVEKHEEKILLNLAYERIVLKAKYSKMLKLLMFFALYSASLLIRSDGAASFEIESRYRIACHAFRYTLGDCERRRSLEPPPSRFPYRHPPQLHLQQRNVFPPAQRRRHHRPQRRWPRLESSRLSARQSGEWRGGG
jgi:hypothetical protein